MCPSTKSADFPPDNRSAETATIPITGALHTHVGGPGPEEKGINGVPPPAASHSPEPLLLTAGDAARLCGTSVRTWRTWDAAGKMPSSVRIGRSALWRIDELRAWVAAGCPDRATWELDENDKISAKKRPKRPPP